MKRSALVRTWLLGGILFALAASCGPSSVLVSIDNIPEDARSLVVLGVHQGGPSAEPVEPFELPSPPPSTSTLLLTLPTRFGGDLEINLAAFDQPSGAGCLLATGLQRAESFQGPNDALHVSLQPLAAPACKNSPVLLLGATPAVGKSAGGETLTLTGWGFRPDATVTIGNAPAVVTYVSATELTVLTPAHVGLGKVPIVVSTPDGASDQSAELFRYYAAPVAFDSMVLDPGTYDDPGSPAIAHFDPSTTIGFCIPLRTAGKVRCSFFLNGNYLAARTHDYIVGMGPSAVAAGDVNNDGAIDLVVTNSISKTVQTLLNDGQGNFSSGATVDVEIDPEAVALSDIDLDGDLDIVVANKGSTTLSILVNPGGGSFSAVVRQPVTPQPVSLAVADVTADAAPDIAVISQLDNEVTLLFNQGGGMFSLAGMNSVNIPVGRMPTNVTLGDVDHNGLLDLMVVSNSTDSVTIFENRLINSLQGYAIFSESDPVAMAFADLNGDSYEDIVVPSRASGNVDVFANTAGAGFRGITYQAVSSGCPMPAQVGALDLDGDGKLDLLTTGQGCVSVLFNRSN